ncbi:hypothetical protein BUALT_Bualt13G0081600 [Buddleja alternifolia]|uniref:Dof zinc finger protein n=1 Tax=Buddleja alternifolia TaxID=168488 RepID=A0AAV6WWP1_9LAMI|nr:hypothetical protein BUALT_Bualt13G0081600 [Buddleja alternifolia]
MEQGSDEHVMGEPRRSGPWQVYQGNSGFIRSGSQPFRNQSSGNCITGPPPRLALPAPPAVTGQRPPANNRPGGGGQAPEMGSETLESMLVSTKSQQEKKPKPADEQAQKCPRCDSTNTKFCYYNNYSLSQPRYFCKSCRRYWTKGGTLRNVPVGGGCRRNKRPSSSSSSASSKRIQDQPITTFPSLSYDHNSNELGLAISRLQRQSGWGGQFGLDNLDFSMSLMNPNMPLSDGLFEFHETPRGFQNMYYGMENGGVGMECDEIMSTAMKQEMCSESRGLWGLPWQSIGGQNGNMEEFDSNRVNWNGIGSSNWHGLLNSPLM